MGRLSAIVRVVAVVVARFRSGSYRPRSGGIAVPAGWNVEHASRTVAEADGARLSDHDLYVIEITQPIAG